MDLLSFNRLKTLWKTLAVCAVTVFMAFLASFAKNGFLGQHHNQIMLGLFVFVFALCGLLIADTLKTLRLQQEQVEVLMGIKSALTSLIDLKYPYTECHSRNVRDLSRQFAEYLKCFSSDFGLKTLEEITLAAELHDIGKIGVPDSVLKKTGELDDTEFLEIKKHPGQGADSLQSLNGFENISKIIRHHHEKHNGTGYPDGLSAAQIPLESRIISIVDSYDAMTHNRSYRKAMNHQKALEIMKKNTGTQFDPKLLNLFIEFIQTKDSKSRYDPVCGMAVNSTGSPFRAMHQKQVYYFCSAVCQNKFNQNPVKFIKNIITNKSTTVD